MTEEPDESPTSEDHSIKPQDLTSESGAHESPKSVSSVNGLRHDRNSAEISGETIDVVGEATGEFPRVSSADSEGAESTGRPVCVSGVSRS